MVDKSPEKIKLMFDGISNKYDFMNNIMSFGLQKSIKKWFVKKILFPKNSIVIDLCTGTGDLALEVAKNKNVAKVIGLDFSVNMLELAKSKNNSPKIEFLEGDCLKLPFQENFADVILMGFGLRNIEQYEEVILEIKRVLKNGGYFGHIDIFRGPLFINKILDLYIKISSKIFGASNCSYDYLSKSKNTFLTGMQLSEKISNYGFDEIMTQSFCFGIIKSHIFIKNY